jgi:hypothetical protein
MLGTMNISQVLLAQHEILHRLAASHFLRPAVQDDKGGSLKGEAGPGGL